MLRVSCQFRVKTLVPRFTHSFSSNSTAAATATLTSEGEVEEAGEYKPPIALVARLRKDTQCSLQKARAALVATRGGLDEAREWLAQESAVSAAGKAQKLENRSAREGLVVVAGAPDAAVTGKIVMLELNSETDFVGNNQLFVDMAARIASTAWVMHEEAPDSNTSTKLFSTIDMDPALLMDCPILPAATMTTSTATTNNNDLSNNNDTEAAGGPLLPLTVRQHLQQQIGRLGENIRLRRITTLLPPTPILFSLSSLSPAGSITPTTSSNTEYLTSSFIHTTSPSLPSNMGRVAAIVGVKCVYTIKPSPETRVALGVLVKRIAQHVVACNPLTLDTTTPSSTTIKKESDEDIDDEITPTALLDQDYFFGGGSVRQVLQSGSPAVPAGVGFEIVSFRRFEVGEFLENEESSTEEKK